VAKEAKRVKKRQKPGKRGKVEGKHKLGTKRQSKEIGSRREEEGGSFFVSVYPQHDPCIFLTFSLPQGTPGYP